MTILYISGSGVFQMPGMASSPVIGESKKPSGVKRRWA